MASTSKGLFGSSLARKYWMAATGLFLCTFLVGHLLGNLQLFVTGEEGRQEFNEYGHFMTTFPLVKILSYLTYISILLHTVDGIMLASQNRAARPVGYVKENQSVNASWASRKMALLGILTLLFLIIHMRSFWYEMHYGTSVREYTFFLGKEELVIKDLWTVTVTAFEDWKYTAFYVLAFLGLALHLSHGAKSAFQSMGINHPKYTPMINKIMTAFAWLIPAGFIAVAIFLFIEQPAQDIVPLEYIVK
ncbi:succinate dehydrogenase cytochrome b subunit [Schleiferiaceae bacterium]|nr:succinate dehydrogenase cytochrome b subunit [Schleiferiaceae bacterium]